MRILLLLTGIIPLAHSQGICSNSPNAVTQFFCNELVSWNQAAANVVSPSAATLTAPGATQSVASLGITDTTNPGNAYTCMDIRCLCNAFGGTGTGTACTLPNGQPLNKIVRKEYRMMTDDERTRFHTAMWTIKNNGVFQDLAILHQNPTIAAGAHGGPAFLPWHREYIKRMEFALRRVDPGIHLPYWDSTLESVLPNPVDSVMFSIVLAGTANGAVVGGAFRGWTALNGGPLMRTVGMYSTPMVQNDVNAVLAQTSVNNVLAYTAPQPTCPSGANFDALEYSHGNLHVWVGGDMLVQTTASADPVFWMHHSFVDFIWEMWRTSRQTVAARETAYPPDNAACSTPAHFSMSPMNPFGPKVNRDGLSNDYTNNLYSYQARPTCALGNNCGSTFLFCDRSHGTPRCGAKARVGGNCAGFTQGEQVCFNSVCQNGVCVATTQTTTQPPIMTTTQIPSTQETCYNENQCCAPWAARGECTRNPNYMRLWCPASCGVCRPTTYTLGIECNNRHPNCARWASTGECQNNPNWMSENCRQACNLCGQTREQICYPAQTTTTTTPRPTGGPATSIDTCFNNHYCCPRWTSANYCTRSPTYMQMTCATSCGFCRTTYYTYGTCYNYHPSCVYWASIGECNRNPTWMRENCRMSCNSCYSAAQLVGLCAVRRQGSRTSSRGKKINPFTEPRAPGIKAPIASNHKGSRAPGIKTPKAPIHKGSRTAGPKGPSGTPPKRSPRSSGLSRSNDTILHEL